MKKFIFAMAMVMVASSAVCDAVARNETNTKTVTIKKGTPHVTREIGNTKEIDKIAVSGFIDVEYTQSIGEACKLTLYGPEELLDLLEIKMQGGTLSIKFKDKINSVGGNFSLKAYVSTPSLTSVSTVGSGDFTFKNAFKGDNISISSSGSGDISMLTVNCNSLSVSRSGSGDFECKDVVCENLSVVSSGSGDMEINGTASGGNLSITKSGSCNASLGNLKFSNVSITSSGSGDTKIKNITAESYIHKNSGSGDISVSDGSCNKVSFITVGSGDVYAKNLTASNVSGTISGSGTISCTATQSFTGSVAGSGVITYYGNPSHVSKSGKASSFVAK